MSDTMSSVKTWMSSPTDSSSSAKSFVTAASNVTTRSSTVAKDASNLSPICAKEPMSKGGKFGVGTAPGSDSMSPRAVNASLAFRRQIWVIQFASAFLIISSAL